DRVLPELERAGFRQRRPQEHGPLRVRHDLPVLSPGRGRGSGVGRPVVTRPPTPVNRLPGPRFPHVAVASACQVRSSSPPPELRRRPPGGRHPRRPPPPPARRGGPPAAAARRREPRAARRRRRRPGAGPPRRTRTRPPRPSAPPEPDSLAW